MRCDDYKPPPGSKPYCSLGAANNSDCHQPPLALRCATNAAATKWSASYEKMFDIVYYRSLP
jgi:hypothetical protein